MTTNPTAAQAFEGELESVAATHDYYNGDGYDSFKQGAKWALRSSLVADLVLAADASLQASQSLVSALFAPPTNELSDGTLRRNANVANDLLQAKLTAYKAAVGGAGE